MTHPDLARLRALAEAAKQDCRIGEESCPACCAKRELTGDVVLALLAEVEAGRDLRDPAPDDVASLERGAGRLAEAVEGPQVTRAECIAELRQ